MTDSGVAGDAFGEFGAGGVVAAFEEFLDAFVHEPEACLHRDDRLADDGEAEVSGLDEARRARVRRGSRRRRALGLRRTGTGRGSRRSGVSGRRRGAGDANRLASAGGVRADVGRVPGGGDAEQVGEFSFETARPGTTTRRGSGSRVGRGRPHDEFDAIVGAGLGEQVDDADVVVVVVAGDEREPVIRRRRATLNCAASRWPGHVDRAAVRSRRRGVHRVITCGGRVQEPFDRPDRDAEHGERDKPPDERNEQRRAGLGRGGSRNHGRLA